MHATSARNLFN